jgi:hypothetical protein
MDVPMSVARGNQSRVIIARGISFPRLLCGLNLSLKFS